MDRSAVLVYAVAVSYEGEKQAKRFPLLFLTLILLVSLSGCPYPWVYANHPCNKYDTTWSTADGKSAFYIPEDTPNSPVIEQFTYGIPSASYNGCETIAVHNAKVLLGMDSTLSDTMEAFQDANAMLACGAFGSDPFSIGYVLQNEGIAYTRVRLDALDKPGTYIISFWTGQIHTVAMTYDGSNYATYNRSTYASEAESGDPHEYASRYICGYYLG